MLRPRNASVLPLLCLLIYAAPAGSQVLSGQVSSSQIDAVFASLKSATAPGAAALVVHHGQVVFRRGYGVTDLRTLQKIDERTNFRLASFTKQFTGVHHAPGARRQAELRRSPHPLLPRVPRLRQLDHRTQSAEPHLWP